MNSALPVSLSPLARSAAFLWGGLALTACAVSAAPTGGEETDELALVLAEIDQTLAEIEALMGPSAPLGMMVDGIGPSGASRWDWSFSTRLGGGADNNILLEPENPVPGAFLALGADLSARYTLTPHQSLRFLGFYEGRQFRAAVPHENLALGELEWARERGNWAIGAVGGLIFSEFVFDATLLTAGPPVSGVVREKRPSAELFVTRKLGERWSVGARAGGSESSFGGTSDDYWTLGATLEADWRPSRQLHWRFWARYEHDRYRAARQRDPRGFLTGDADALGLSSLQVGTATRWRFTEHWSFYSPLWVELDRDNGGAYYDRARIYLQPRVSWRRGLWNLSLTGTYLFVDYAERQLTPVDAEAQWQEKWGLSLEVRRSFGWHWAVFGSGGHAVLASNLDAVSYRNWVGQAGVEYDF